MNVRHEFAGAGRFRGFTLVEMMVALVIGSLLMAAVSQVYLTNKVTFTVQDQTARVMESSSFALGFLDRDIRMAGYSGCASRVLGSGAVKSYLNSTSYIYDLGNGAISGAEAQGTGPGSTFSISATNPAVGGSFAPVLAGYTGVVTVPGSDVLLVSVLTDTSKVTGFHTGANVEADDVSAFTTGDIVVVSDCLQATIFQATNVNTSSSRIVGSGSGSVSPGNSTPISETGPVSAYKTENASISRLRTYVYYVGVGSDGTPSLFRAQFRDGQGVLTSEELINGVESMQIVYGLDNEGDYIADSYVAADGVTGWNQVRSVRVGLLMRTPQEIRSDDDTDTYDVAGTTIDPVDDGRVRRVVTTTIALRNRLL